MKLYSGYDAEFKPHGQVQHGFPTEELLAVLANTPVADGVEYMACEPALQALPVQQLISEHLYGGMPVQLGQCNGHNTKLNCLECHRDSEFNLGTEDFILLLARQDELENGLLDTARVRVFWIPAGTLVEVYAPILHCAPCHMDANKGFRVMVVLPWNSNTGKPEFTVTTEEDKRLWARNKQRLAHPDSAEAKQGAYVGLTGENIDISTLI